MKTKYIEGLKIHRLSQWRIDLSNCVKRGTLNPAPTSGSPRLLISETEKTASVLVHPLLVPARARSWARGTCELAAHSSCGVAEYCKAQFTGAKASRITSDHVFTRPLTRAGREQPAGRLRGVCSHGQQCEHSSSLWGDDWEEVFHFELMLWNDMFSWDSRHFLISTCLY